MCVDRNMIIPLIVAITSIVNTLQDEEKINLFLFYKGITKRSRKYVENLGFETPVDFNWVEIRDTKLEMLAMRSGWSPVIFFRLFLSDLLPEDIQRIVYLDADTLVCKPISYLYNINLNNCIIGAITDPSRPWLGMQRGCVPARMTGIPANAPYFNSGVMVIDVKHFREKNIGKEALNYALKYAELLDFPDQDALNVVLHGHWKSLDPRWNQVSSIYQEHGILHCQLSVEELAQLRRDPFIIHYTGALPRPWIDPSGHPLASRWKEVFELTNRVGLVFTGRKKNRAFNLLRRLKRALSIILRG